MKNGCLFQLLENINLVPAFLKTAVKDIPNEIMHVVSFE